MRKTFLEGRKAGRQEDRKAGRQEGTAPVRTTAHARQALVKGGSRDAPAGFGKAQSPVGGASRLAYNAASPLSAIFSMKRAMSSELSLMPDCTHERMMARHPLAMNV